MARTPSVASARPQRAPLGKRDRLAIKNKEEGFVYRIVNDVDDRVEQLKGNGYEVCTVEQVGAIGNKRVEVLRLSQRRSEHGQRTGAEEIKSVERGEFHSGKFLKCLSGVFY